MYTVGFCANKLHPNSNNKTFGVQLMNSLYNQFRLVFIHINYETNTPQQTNEIVRSAAVGKMFTHNNFVHFELDCMRSLLRVDEWKEKLKEQLWHKQLTDSLSDKPELTCSELKYLTLVLEMRIHIFAPVATSLTQTPCTAPAPSRTSHLMKKLLTQIATIREPTLEIVDAYIGLFSKVNE